MRRIFVASSDIKSYILWELSALLPKKKYEHFYTKKRILRKKNQKVYNKIENLCFFFFLDVLFFFGSAIFAKKIIKKAF